MLERRDRGLRRERLVDAAPHGHWHTTNFIAALLRTGLTAPLVLHGPMTGEAFLTHARQFLARTLAKGDVVIRDNLPTTSLQARARQSGPPAPAFSTCRPPALTRSQLNRPSPS
jgi:hypothetical protein